MNPSRIVIADDQAAVRHWIREVLASAPDFYELLEAADGSDVIRLVRSGSIDLVIVDLFMPGKEGIETIQSLRREAPRVPIIAMSGSLQPQYLEIARALGAHDALSKPFSAAELHSAVSRLLPPRP